VDVVPEDVVLGEPEAQFVETSEESSDRLEADNVAGQLMGSGNVPNNVGVDERGDGTPIAGSELLRRRHPRGVLLSGLRKPWGRGGGSEGCSGAGRRRSTS
jgi:hypothetical protein